MNESLDELRAENERLRDALASRDAALQERDAALQERDATLKERDASLSARDAKIVDYELRVLKLAVEVNRLERQLFGGAVRGNHLRGAFQADHLADRVCREATAGRQDQGGQDCGH